MIENYVALENVRFSENIELQVDNLEQLNLKEIHVPPLLLQPIVENSIVHGLLPQKKGGNINIQINKLSDNNLSIDVIDDGIGLDENKDLEDVDGYGLRLTKSRLITLSKNGNGVLELRNRKANSEKGTIVSMKVPFKTYQ